MVTSDGVLILITTLSNVTFRSASIQLMHLMAFADKHKNNNFCVSWLSDGKSFVVSNPDEFTRQVLPKYFKATKFTSFTRKLSRWGFRQLNRDPIIFGNEFFQRDDAELMTKMRSVTAASNRKEEHSTIQFLAQRRALDAIESEREQKRILFDQLIQQKALNFNNHFNSQSMFAQNPVSGLNLTNALRPGLSPGGFNGFGGSGLKTFDMLGQNNPLMNAFPSMQGNNLRSLSNPSQQYPNTTSHADIVNAAINALRFA